VNAASALHLASLLAMLPGALMAMRSRTRSRFVFETACLGASGTGGAAGGAAHHSPGALDALQVIVAVLAVINLAGCVVTAAATRHAPLSRSGAIGHGLAPVLMAATLVV
jgi:hypothetical protein